MTGSERGALGLAGVLGAHRFLARNQAGRMGCRGCTWTTSATPGTDKAWDQYAAHVEAALLAHLADVLGSDETREVVAERLSAREMTEYSRDAHEDHNRWSWRGDGHGEVMRDEFRAEADAALAAVREVLGLPGGGA